MLYAGVLYLPGLGAKAVFSQDEAQRAVPPREMLQHGDWLVPRLNGEAYIKKPPLLYWQVAGLYHAFGVSEWTARLPSALAGMALVGFLFAWTGEFANRRAAVFAALIFAGNLIAIDKSRECQLDIPMTLCTMLALRAMWLSLTRRDAGLPGAWSAALMAGVWLGLANMYKFPVPYLFPAVALLFAALAWGRVGWFLTPRWLLVLIVSFAPFALWAWGVVESEGLDEVRETWLREGRLRIQPTRINSGPIWFYVVQITATFSPWFLFMFKWLRRPFRARHAALGPIWPLLWGAGPVAVLVLSLVPSKEPEYILPALAPTAVLLGLAVDDWLRGGRVDYPIHFGKLRLVLGLFLVSLLAVPLTLRLRDAYLTAGNTTRHYAVAMRQAERAGARIGIFRSGKPHFFFYLGKRVPEWRTAAELAAGHQPHRHLFLLTRTAREDELRAAFPRLEGPIQPRHNTYPKYAFYWLRSADPLTEHVPTPPAITAAPNYPQWVGQLREWIGKYEQ